VGLTVPPSDRQSHIFEYRHIVGFQETNAAGNVYWVHVLAWQGRCRELFLREFAPDVLSQMESGLHIVTLRCACDYYRELMPLDEVVVRMSLGRVTAAALELKFEYWRQGAGDGDMVARGSQRIAFMRRVDGELVPESMPDSLWQRAELARLARGPAPERGRRASIDDQ
jgi:enediyne biosynthesis thioesterase